MNYKAVIFDLDGTLVHTLPDYRYKIVGQTLKDLGKKSTKPFIDRFWFESRRDEIVEKNFKLSLEDFWMTYKKYDTIELREQFTKLYDDVDFVKELRKNNFKTGIVTGAPVHIAELETEMLGRKNFDAIVVANTLNGFRKKPDPHGLEECMNLLGVDKNKTIYVGNADEDIETARNAKVFDILIDRSEHKFPELNPSLTIYSLYELRNFLKI